MNTKIDTRPGRAAYKALKMELARNMYGQRDIAEMLDRSVPYVNVRMRGDATFEIGEGYAILEMLNLPDSYFPAIFPRDPFEPVNAAYRSTRRGQ